MSGQKEPQESMSWRGCGARTRAGGACQQPAMANGRCRLHGGKSTGPRTPEGLQRVREVATKHGRRSAAAIAFRREIRSMLKQAARLAEIQ